MSIAKMQKIKILGLKNQKKKALDLLQGLGLFETIAKEEPSAELDREVNYDALLSDLEFAISFLEPFENAKKSFIDSFAESRELVSYYNVKEKTAKIDFENYIKKSRYFEEGLANIDELCKRLERERELLEPWKNLDVDLNQLAKSGEVKFFAGTIQATLFDELKEDLSPLLADIIKVEEGKLGLNVVVASHVDEEEKVVTLLAEKDFSFVQLPVCSRTPEEELQRIAESLKEASFRREDICEKAKKLARVRFDLMCIHDFFLQKKIAQKTEKNIDLSPYTYVIEGWIKKRQFGFLEKKLKSFFPESLIVPIDPEEGEEPPIAIENRSIIRPFESVTGIYGLPAYKEVDPTPLLATFFILFFGLCLGDAGYGITLSVVAFVMYKKVGPTSSARKLLKLLGYGGIATFIAGALTGGWFGIEPDAFPEILAPARDFLLSIRVIDPVDNPIGMLVVALSFGVVQILFGIMIDMYMKIRDGDYLDAVLDCGLWIYFLSVLILFVVQKTGAFFVTDKIGTLILVGAGLLVVTQGRKQKNIFLKIGTGVLSLYNTVGYLSDILSYSRLLALGLATSIIALVINMVALMTKDIPVVGYIIMTLLLIGGHIFNIAVNVLGSFIHSARLQFVEFFSKFLQGGGTEFSPFKRESKFIEIEKSAE